MTYIGCTVCELWHNFQNFAEWYDENYSAGMEGYHLDKDIKIKGNKVYSPSTCMFVKPGDNTIQATAKHYRLNSPNGVLHEIYNMRKFCRDHELNRSSMIAVSKGKQKTHKGWTKSN